MKISVPEKDRRREATKARDRAYHARYRARLNAETAGEADIDARFGPEIGPAVDAERRAWAEMDAAIAEVNRQIDALQVRRDEMLLNHQVAISTTREVTSEIYGRRNAAKQSLENAMDREFPDLCGPARWSAAAWKSIEDFL